MYCRPFYSQAIQFLYSLLRGIRSAEQSPVLQATSSKKALLVVAYKNVRDLMERAISYFKRSTCPLLNSSESRAATVRWLCMAFSSLTRGHGPEWGQQWYSCSNPKPFECPPPPHTHTPPHPAPFPPFNNPVSPLPSFPRCHHHHNLSMLYPTPSDPFLTSILPPSPHPNPTCLSVCLSLSCIKFHSFMPHSYIYMILVILYLLITSLVRTSCWTGF